MDKSTEALTKIRFYIVWFKSLIKQKQKLYLLYRAKSKNKQFIKLTKIQIITMKLKLCLRVLKNYKSLYFFNPFILIFIQMGAIIGKNIFFCEDLSQMLLFRSQLRLCGQINSKQLDSCECSSTADKMLGKDLFNSINTYESAQISSSTIWKCLFQQFKSQITLCYCLKQIDFILRVTLCIFISLIFQSFQQGFKWKCYLNTGITGIVWILQAIFSQCSLKQVQQNSLRIKGSLTYALYLKILSVPSLSINGNQSGQIINSITEFHDILQNQSIHMFGCLSAPICIIGMTVLLVSQIGWTALAGVAFFLILQFIHYHYAQYNSRYCNNISKLKDERVQILTEAISAFRYIKMQVWEKLFIKKISSIRSEEMKNFLKYAAGKSLERSLNEGINAPTVLLIVGLAARMNDALSSKEILFSVLSIFMISMFIIYSSFGINCYYRVNTLLQRVASIFSKENKKKCELMDQPKQAGVKKQMEQQGFESKAIVLESLWCSYKQDIDNQYILKQVNLAVKKGEFIGLFGKVGKGKSTLFYTLAKQITNIKGKVTVSEELSFQQSQPALFIGTVKQNILFGKQFNRQLYKKSIKYSCLDSDIELFPSGDQTLIEEGGVNLSGGQRIRLCLARTIYANKPILLLDDPLSSVDLKVMQRIVCNLFKLNKSEGKTIILGTHQMHCLVSCDRCLQVRDGSLYELTGQQFDRLKQNYKESRYQYKANHKEQQVSKDEQQCETGGVLYKKQGNSNQSKSKKIQISQGDFICSLFNFAFKNKANYAIFPITLLIYGICQSFYYVFIFYLNQFDQVKAERNSDFHSLNSYWLFLGIMTGCIFVTNNLRSFLLNLTVQLANQSLHDEGLSHVFRSHILELDKIGTKGILDKFSTDLGLLDVGVTPHLHCQIDVITIFTIQLIIISIVNPIMIPFIIAIMIPNYLWYLYCINTIQTLREMDLQQKGSVISLFSETINGLAQIHVMKAQEHMLAKIQSTVNRSIRLGVIYRNIFRAFSANLNYYTTLMIVGSYFAIIAMNEPVDYTNFTFAAVFLVQTNDWIIWAFQYATSINSTLVSAKRLGSLSQIKTEVFTEDNKGEQVRRQSSQVRINVQENDIIKPSQSIQLRNICLKYGEGQNLALKNISISVKVGQRIALIGRTGSGKSSIIQVLYRLVEAEKGSKYFIEGENALTMNIERLRQKFTCIPQTPFLYSDTVRSNLDPFDKFSDEQLKQALRKVCIFEFVERLPKGIHTSLANGDVSLSGGQKQLICLARAILQNKSILILDEATSNIDEETDEVIQKVLRKEFVGKTIVCVAHRLQTILDFDKIIVLSHGSIIQQGNADKLMSDKKEFYEMVHESRFQNQLARKSQGL